MKTLEEVCSGIRRWNKYKKDIVLLQSLHAVKGFTFEVGKKLLAGENFHVYFGLDDKKKFEFYLISSIYDTATTLAEDHVETALQIVDVTQEQITSKEALTRIGKWKDPVCFEEWLLRSIKSDTMVEAFFVPGIDIDAGSVKFDALFGLKDISSDIAGLGFQVDLILTDGAHVFYDTVMPVPPFGPKHSPTDEKRFYLLELALNVHKTDH